MKSKNKNQDPLPQEFSSYEEAGEFWDTHDSTDYLECMTPVEVDGRLDRRQFEIEVDEKVIKALQKRAYLEHISVSNLANNLLRRELLIQ